MCSARGLIGLLGAPNLAMLSFAEMERLEGVWIPLTDFAPVSLGGPLTRGVVEGMAVGGETMRDVSMSSGSSEYNDSMTKFCRMNLDLNY